MKPAPLSDDPRSAAAKEEEKRQIELSFHIPDSSYGQSDDLDGEDLTTNRKWVPVVSVLACVIAVLMDPLFFFIPYIDEGGLCVGTSEWIKSIALTSRALTDITFLVHIIFQIRGAVQVASNSKTFGWLKRTKAIARELPYRYFLTDILAILPIPQVVDYIYIVYLNLKYIHTMRFSDEFMCIFVFQVLIVYLFYHSKSLITLRAMIPNFIILAQYFPRMYRIFLSSRKFGMSNELWFKGLFYFFMYILASYVLGAFYYYNTIQRQVICWQQVSFTNETDPSAAVGEEPQKCPYEETVCSILYDYVCDDHNANHYNLPGLRVISQRKDSCLENAGDFQFGIFKVSNKTSDLLLGDSFVFDKLLYYIWWGLKNVSNFGTSLETSPAAWESCFAIVICTTGLILFAYLIGNMQQCMQSADKKIAISGKVEEKKQDMLVWMEANHLSEKLRKKIIAHIKQNLENDKDADLEHLFSILPWNSVKSLKPALCINVLNKVPGLQHMDTRGLIMICHLLKPVIYPEETIIFRVGEPLDRMLFIIEGTVFIYSSSSDTIYQDAGKEITVHTPPMIHGSLEKGEVYGDEQLLSWVSSRDVPISYTTLPISTKNVRCHTKIEGFSLTAKDLRTVVSLYKLHPNPDNNEVQILEERR